MKKHFYWKDQNGSEWFINLDRIDYVSLKDGLMTWTLGTRQVWTKEQAVIERFQKLMRKQQNRSNFSKKDETLGNILRDVPK